MLPNLKLPTQVAVICANASPPLLARGRCIVQNGDELTLDLAGTNDIPANATLILDFMEEPAIDRVISAYMGKREGHVIVQVTRLHHSDKREFPRMNGGISLRYHVLPKEDTGAALDAWLRGGEANSTEHDPDPFMNFSVTGLAFDDLETCAGGDHLAFVITVPGSEHSWRGAASVVRVSRIPIDERDDTIPATHRVAVDFTELPDDARVALGKHTERVQEAWL